jgi:hypothetical protein
MSQNQILIDLDTIDDPELLEYLLYSEDPLSQSELIQKYYQTKNENDQNDSEIPSEDLVESHSQSLIDKNPDGSFHIDNDLIHEPKNDTKNDPKIEPENSNFDRIDDPNIQNIPRKNLKNSEIISTPNLDDPIAPLHPSQTPSLNLPPHSSTPPLDQLQGCELPPDFNQDDRIESNSNPSQDANTLNNSNQNKHILNPCPNFNPLSRINTQNNNNNNNNTIHSNFYTFGPLLTQDSGVVKTLQHFTKNANSLLDLPEDDMEMIIGANVQYLMQYVQLRGNSIQNSSINKQGDDDDSQPLQKNSQLSTQPTHLSRSNNLVLAQDGTISKHNPVVITNDQQITTIGEMNFKGLL